MNLETAPTQFASAQEYRGCLTNVVFRAHLARLPSAELRTEFVNTLTEQAAADTPHFLLDYWRLNLHSIRA
jgi:hypothetical protein